MIEGVTEQTGDTPKMPSGPEFARLKSAERRNRLVVDPSIMRDGTVVIAGKRVVSHAAMVLRHTVMPN